MNTILGRAIFSLSIFLILLASILIITNVVTKQQKDDSLIINLSGRQRMLTQKMTKEILIFSNITQRYEQNHLDKWKDQLFKTMAVFETTLFALKDGGSAPLNLEMTQFRVMPPASQKEISAGLNKVVNLWLPLKENIKAVIDSVGQDSKALDYVIANNVELLTAMNKVVFQMQAEAERKVLLMFNAQLLAVIIGFLLVIFIALIIKFSIVNPIIKLTHIAHLLAEGKTKLNIEFKRKDEIGMMSKAFRQMIINLQQVIEDIVRISQGLADGNLHVTPQSEYRGDFIEIKNALEMALSNQSKVIDDIVIMSQKLAAGERTTPQAEYRGNFVQIKNALETASVKLLEATKQNAMQDWLKTGQAQLSELMSGEHDMSTLAKKIICFLTIYVEGKMGLFYLLKEPYLEMIANYAYTKHESIPNKFRIGEGLVGEAALNKKMLSRIHSQEESFHIIQSGLSIAVPHQALIIPFMYEETLKGVIEIGASKTLTHLQQDFLQQVMPNIGIAVNTAESRSKMQALLENT